MKVAIFFGCVTFFLTAVQVGLALKGIQLNPALGNVFLALALLSLLGLLTTLGWIFIPWIRNSWAWAKRHSRYLWIVGGAIAFGLLLGGVEWLISNSLSNALWIGLPAFVLAQLAFMVWASRLEQSQNRVQKLTDASEQVEQLNKNLEAELETLTKEEDFKKKENAKLKQELHKVRHECERLREENNQLRNQRDWQIRVRCRKLADGLDRLLEGWERDDPKSKEALREYRNQFRGDVARVVTDLKQFDLWKPKVDYPEMLENPENRKDVQDLAGYLRWVANGFPI